MKTDSVYLYFTISMLIEAIAESRFEKWMDMGYEVNDGTLKLYIEYDITLGLNLTLTSDTDWIFRPQANGKFEIVPYKLCYSQASRPYIALYGGKDMPVSDHVVGFTHLVDILSAAKQRFKHSKGLTQKEIENEYQKTGKIKRQRRWKKEKKKLVDAYAINLHACGLIVSAQIMYSADNAGKAQILCARLSESLSRVCAIDKPQNREVNSGNARALQDHHIQ